MKATTRIRTNPPLTTPRTVRCRTAVVVVVLALALAACGGDDGVAVAPAETATPVAAEAGATAPAATDEPTPDADPPATDAEDAAGPGILTTEPGEPDTAEASVAVEPPADPLGAVCDAWSATLAAGFMALFVGLVLSENAEEVEVDMADEESLFTATILLTAPALAPRYEVAAAGLPVDELTETEAEVIEQGAPFYRSLADEVEAADIDPALLDLIEGIVSGEIDIAAGEDEELQAEFAGLLIDGINTASAIEIDFDDPDDLDDEGFTLTFDRFGEVCPDLVTSF